MAAKNETEAAAKEVIYLPQNSLDFFAFEIGPRFEDSEKLTRRDLRFASSLIGFDWV